MKPTIIKSDGTTSSFTFEGSSPSLKEMQTIVGGYIEPLRLSGNPALVMVTNEEGLMRQLPFNLRASVVAGRSIVGDVIVMAEELMT